MTCSVTPPLPILTVTGKEESLACLMMPLGTPVLIRITPVWFSDSASDSAAILAGDGDST